MTLENWFQNGWLVRHRPTKNELAELMGVVDRDIRDATARGLSPDWRFAIAYNAALQCAAAALAAVGYRPARQAHHYRALQSLALTLGEDEETIQTLDAFRKKRNVADYERAGSVSEAEADEMLELARALRDRLSRWLKRHRTNSPND